MYSKKFRLPVKEVQKKAKKVFSSPYFLIKTAENKTDHNRFGIIISTSSVQKSVDRHFWKRRIADYLRQTPNFKKDFLFIVSPGIKKSSPEKVKNELDKFFKII